MLDPAPSTAARAHSFGPSRTLPALLWAAMLALGAGCGPADDSGDPMADAGPIGVDGGDPAADGGDPFMPDPFEPRADCEVDPDGPGCDTGSDFRLVEAVPADGATEVPLAEGISFRFSAPVDRGSLDNDTISTEGPDRRRAGSFFGDDETPTEVRFIPGGGLAAGTTYVTRVSTAMRSVDGAPLAEEVVIGFTTEGERVPLTPRVTYTEPSLNSSSVRPDAVFRLDFNTRMDPASFGPDAVVLAPEEGGAAAEVAVEIDGRTIRITPAAPLAIGTRYTLAVSAGVLSVEGVALPERYAAGFSTVAPLDVVSASPFDGEEGVRIDLPIEIRMSAAIDPETVDPIGAVSVRADTWVANRPRPDIAGTTEVRGDTLIFTPDDARWQEYATGYRVTLNFGIRGVNGEVASRSLDLTFRTVFLDAGSRYAFHDEARDLDTTLATDELDGVYMAEEARGPRTQWYGTPVGDGVYTLHTVAGGDGLSLLGGDGVTQARLTPDAPGPDQRWSFRRYNPREARDVQRAGESPRNYYLYTGTSGEDQVLTGLWDDARALRVPRIARRQALVWQLFWIERLGPR